MCGIVGAIAQRDVVKILLEGLRRLEYRGYDSAGIAVIDDKQELLCIRALGNVEKLTALYDQCHLKGMLGIAHTRWATHGKPSEQNAHPQQSEKKIALVHNGIIENYEQLREMLHKEKYTFDSETDTETVAHLVHFEASKTSDYLAAVTKAVKQLEGAYALGIINADEPGRLIAVRHGSPLVIGLGIDENFIASDTLALLPVTQKFVFLEEGDIADITLDQVAIYNKAGKKVERKVFNSTSSSEGVNLNGYRHFMQKEIFEQPAALQETLEGRLTDNKIFPEVFGLHAKEMFGRVQHIQIVACGTSYNAGAVARYWLEEIAGVSCQVEIASEIRYRKAVVLPNTLFVTLSQSGETADTLAALKQAKELGYLATLAICNVPESSLVRESDFVFMTRAGREIGVASTKAFTTQLLSLLILTVMLAQDKLEEKERVRLIQLIKQVPKAVADALELNDNIKALANYFSNKEHALFLGRGSQHPIAMEGALKLKEISYIHAEAYPAGELKHGPLALVDKEMPVVVVAPNDELLGKLKSNLQEVRARGAELIVFADKNAGLKNQDGIIYFEMPSVDRIIAPIVYTIPLQLLSYYVALIKGTDVDHPRNLAKSVTVE